jgi:hypothetical protein
LDICVVVLSMRTELLLPPIPQAIHPKHIN